MKVANTIVSLAKKNKRKKYQRFRLKNKSLLILMKKRLLRNIMIKFAEVLCLKDLFQKTSTLISKIKDL